MAASRAADGLPSSWAHFLATRMLAAMRMVRLRPSSIGAVYHVRFCFAHGLFAGILVYSSMAGDFLGR